MATKKTAPKKAKKPEAPVFQQVFKTVDDPLRKDAGCTSELDYTEQSSELDYTEQSSWLLFLKYGGVNDALKAIGATADGVRDAFFDFQKFLYEESVA